MFEFHFSNPSEDKAFYVFNMENSHLYAYYKEDASFRDKDTKKIKVGNFIYGVSLDSNGDLLNEIYNLFEKGIISEQGLQDIGIWKESKKAHKISNE